MGVTRFACPSGGGQAARGLAVCDPALAAGEYGRLGGAGARSLEVRWIFAGRLVAGMTAWFRRFPVQRVTLTDTYLVDPDLPGLSVKIRDRRALETKAYHGNPGLLEVPMRARGHLESWQKWSFPCAPPGAGSGSGDPAGWRTVRKRRLITRFARADETAETTALCFAGPAGRPECAVELAEFRALGKDWWTLGFEATGPDDALAGQLDAAAALVFAQALPGAAELHMDDSMSYAQWLRRLITSRGAIGAGLVIWSRRRTRGVVNDQRETASPAVGSWPAGVHPACPGRAALDGAAELGGPAVRLLG